MSNAARSRRGATGGRHRQRKQRKVMAGNQQHYLAAGALATAGVMAVTPVAPITALPRAAELATVQAATQLVAGGESLLNVPLNLLQALFNIPFNEVNALDLFGRSMIWSGPWLSVGATNLWGEDPGDQGHFAGILDALFPFSKINGMYDPLPGYINPDAGVEGSPYADLPDFNWTDAANGDLGLSQQIILMLNAEIPVSAASDATYSSPLFPVPPITGLTSIDKALWNIGIFTGQQKFPLIDNWFKVPMQDLQNGYTFPEHIINPSAGPGEGGQVITDNAFGGKWIPYGFPGTEASGTTGTGTLVDQWQMPWSGQEFKLDLSKPFDNFFQSLMQPTDGDFWSFNGDDPTVGFHLPDINDIAHMLQNFFAGLIIAFDPIVPGSVLFCPGDCTFGLDGLKAIISGINALWPGNTALTHWLDQLDQQPVGLGPGGLPNPYGLDNGATEQGVNSSTAFGSFWQQLFDFGNPYPDDSPTSVETPLSFPTSPFMQSLIDFFKPVRDFLEPIATGLGYEPIDYSSNAWWGGPADTLLDDGSVPVDDDAGLAEAAADVA